MRDEGGTVRRDFMHMKAMLEAHSTRSVSELLWELEDPIVRREMTVTYMQIIDLPELGQAL